MEDLAETQSGGAGPGCCTPTCPRSLLEKECHSLEREIPILQVSCNPGPTSSPHSAFLLNVDTATSHLVREPTYMCVCVCACM